uniref:Uncharacterized protein n=1 Tax=Xiphophorus maculatus TaxID=8083 RepID=A0A3B5QPZ9_XIPMA
MGDFRELYNPKHTAGVKLECLRPKYIDVLEWPSQSLKAVKRPKLSNLTDFELLCERICISKCANFVALYPTRLTVYYSTRIQ